MPYQVIVETEAKERFLALDNSVRIKILKKLKQMEIEDLQSRHFKHGIPVFIEEVGQFRIIFKLKGELKEKRVMFIGDHKEYEKWYKSQK